ncbi:hypothetical protein L228DRAFT_102497 [Xylona heveae TC161]|uniref:CWH43-like N-terminal domain-containing protein n=1 Tax=Xylona heveae (strain CBS 132557 / TC161) TaxID=1328760 RepID=A0A165IC79_XYLHT|nr:hypothetical protein L228DRAFT_102497 [Xylona heveae TC161]KZF24695.1 hypothetical protein L228DRAFT_102497 [Xylona heveae TC161]
MFGLSYWVFPLVSAGMWLGMLLAMLITWEAEGHPHYASMESGQRIAYISDIGAQGLKPLFITGCVITTVFLDLSFASERWLRHRGRLARNVSISEKILSGLSIAFAIAGTAGLILLSIFDTLHHPRMHDGFLVLFIGGYVISAIFICAEYQRLGIKYRQYRVLRFSFWIKLTFIITEIALAIAFGVCGHESKRQAAAVLEWIIALIFTFYVLTFFIDLLPAVRTKNKAVREAQQEMGINPAAPAPHDGQFFEPPSHNSLDSRAGLTNDGRHYRQPNF